MNAPANGTRSDSIDMGMLPDLVGFNLRCAQVSVFQDFNRYQLEVGENIGVGDEPHLRNATRWGEAAQMGQAASFIEDLPEKYHTQLGRWFHDGQELSGGQWQRIALSRAFMRQGAEILVLDEPTAAMDAETEAEIFEHFRKYPLKFTAGIEDNQAGEAVWDEEIGEGCFEDGVGCGMPNECAVGKSTHPFK